MGFKDSLARVLYRPICMYNIIKINAFYSKFKPDAKEISAPLEHDRILIIVPHVDDETIGMGGYLAEYGNKQIDIIYLTDSGKSESDVSNIVEVRKEEARSLLESLGLNSFKILAIPNGSVAGYEEYAEEELEKTIKVNGYNKIFTVSPFDAHNEHRWTTQRLAGIVDRLEGIDNIYLYEVSNLLPSGLINTYFSMNSKILKSKSQLYKLFESQFKTMDFKVFELLNKGKGKAIGKNSAEFFMDLKPNEFKAMMDEIENLDMDNVLPYRIGNNRSFYKVIGNEDRAQSEYRKIFKKRLV